MSPLEKFITRHKLARYAFVLITFPIAAVSDRVKGIWNPADMCALRTALRWARTGVPASQQRPEPSPLSPKWQQRVDQDAGAGSSSSEGGVR